MGLRRFISKRSFDGYRVASPSSSFEFPPFSSSSPHSDASGLNFRREYISPPDSAGKGFFRRFLQRRAIYHSPANATARIPGFLSLPVGDKLREKLEGNNIAGDRIRLDGLIPPASRIENESSVCGISIDDARKIMRMSQAEKLKAKLRDIPMSSISYSEFNRICVEGCGNEEQGAEFAKLLDESGSVIVLGNIVFLRPDQAIKPANQSQINLQKLSQVAKSMETMLSQSIATPDDPRFKQLAEMEDQKAIIDRKAKAQVQGELHCGLGLFLIQTLGFMRLTFWELSWDVMEPICFFVTSLHFALGYGFFLYTSTEPTFQGFFRRRFIAKQKKLMASHNFDINKYYELLRACYPSRGTLPNHEEGELFNIDHSLS